MSVTPGGAERSRTKYPITVDGLSAGSVGATDITASGKVYHLKKLEDFEGNYAAVRTGATVGGGGSVATMRNQNGALSIVCPPAKA